jgi:hypothetical protein
MHIREPLEEQEREDVGLEVRRIHRSLQKPRGFPEVGFELGVANGDVDLGLCQRVVGDLVVTPLRHAFTLEVIAGKQVVNVALVQDEVTDRDVAGKEAFVPEFDLCSLEYPEVGADRTGRVHLLRQKASQ